MKTIVENAKSGVERVHEQDIAVLVPCFNEQLTVGRTVAAFRAALPSATIYVYDNNSTDGTVEVAEAAGAVIRHETRQGKGNVVRRMFASRKSLKSPDSKK